MRLSLVLLRHGEAESAQGLQDHSRRLTPHGQEQAANTAAALRTAGFAPTLVLTSDAVRARSTAELAHATLAPGAPCLREPGLYLAGLEAIAAVISRHATARDVQLLVVGHNPGFSSAASILAGESLRLGTGDAAHLVLEADTWAEGLQMQGAWELKK